MFRLAMVDSRATKRIPFGNTERINARAMLRWLRVENTTSGRLCLMSLIILGNARATLVHFKSMNSTSGGTSGRKTACRVSTTASVSMNWLRSKCCSRVVMTLSEPPPANLGMRNSTRNGFILSPRPCGKECMERRCARDQRRLRFLRTTPTARRIR